MFDTYSAQHRGTLSHRQYLHSSRVKEAKMPGPLERIRAEMDVSR